MGDGDAIVDTRSLFRPLHTSLIDVLRTLGGDDWIRPIGAGEWTVRDVAAHLLDGDLRRISADRDAHVPAPAGPITGYDDLLAYLDDLNARWTRAARRISTPLLVDLLEYTGPLVARLMESAQLEGEATFPVAWAGQQRSSMWLDIGREYTERWHHQDQLREAVGADAVAAPHLLRAVIAVSLYAFPAALRGMERPDGTRAAITATGAAGGTWHIERRAGEWRLAADAGPVAAERSSPAATDRRSPAATDRSSPAARGESDRRGESPPAVSITAADLDLARLLMHRLTPAQTAERVRVSGDRELAAAMSGARAVMV